MKAVEKALWFIEANPVVTLTLDDVARHAGLSRFYLARAFEAATGYPVMRYVRARRLTAAARALAAGAPDILAVALDAGGKVTIPGFGTFGTKTRKARTGTNPKDQSSIQIPEKSYAYFKAGKTLRERVAK